MTIKILVQPLLFICMFLFLFACNKNSLELAPVSIKPITTNTEVMYRGQKILDLQLDRFNYTDSNFMYINIRNLSAGSPDSLSILLYYFKSNSQVFDSVGFLPLPRSINQADTHRIHFAKFYNLRIPAGTGALHAELISHKKSSVASNLVSGYYNGYAIQTLTATANPTRYSAAKGFISSEGNLKLWVKDAVSTFKIESLLPKDTTLMTNIFLRNQQDELTAEFQLDILTGNTHFDITDYKLDFIVANADANSDPKSIKFNLIKNPR